MKVLITGSSGFVGTRLVKLSSNLYTIIELDLIKNRIFDIEMKSVEAVIHLAALVHQINGAPEDQYFKVNRDLAFEVAKHAKDCGVKQFILMSTAKVYGESTSSSGYWNEESECVPSDAYGKSKFEAENLIRRLEDSDFKVAIVRSPLVYGGGVKANMFNFIRLVDNLSLIPLGGIKNKRSVVYIDNLVALINRILEKKVSGIYIAGDRSPLSTTEIIKLIASGFNKKIILLTVPKVLLILIRKIRPAIFNRLFGSLIIDPTITNRVLNFNPPYPSEVGINEMVKWYTTIKRAKRII